MSRHILSLSHEHLTSFDLEAFVVHAEALNQHHRETLYHALSQGPQPVAFSLSVHTASHRLDECG